jgi:5,6,7,8-tetrahydromethanopterin hydro-lyase
VALEIGEGFAGEGAESAHVNTVLGPRDGPAGAAFATALATPSAGHVPFIVVLQPNLPVKPFTLFVSKATLAGDAHAALTWGAAQAGVAGGVADAVADGSLPRGRLDELALIAAVWVAPEARDEEAVYRNNRAATRAALAAGRAHAPQTEAMLAARGSPWNPFFRPDGGVGSRAGGKSGGRTRRRGRKGLKRRRARAVR